MSKNLRIFFHERGALLPAPRRAQDFADFKGFCGFKDFTDFTDFTDFEQLPIFNSRTIELKSRNLISQNPHNTTLIFLHLLQTFHLIYVRITRHATFTATLEKSSLLALSRSLICSVCVTLLREALVYFKECRDTLRNFKECRDTLRNFKE